MKQYLVIGLEDLEVVLQRLLYDADESVLAIETCEEIVQEAINNDIVDNAVIADATDEKALKDLGVENFDVAFVCIGNNLQASILITLTLKELGIPKVICKAVTQTHGKALAKIGADEIIYPEEYMGRRIALSVMNPNIVEHLRFSQDFILAELKAPISFENKTLLELDVRNNYNLNIIGIKKASGDLNSNPAAQDIIVKGDTLLVITDAKTASQFEKENR